MYRYRHHTAVVREEPPTLCDGPNCPLSKPLVSEVVKVSNLFKIMAIIDKEDTSAQMKSAKILATVVECRLLLAWRIGKWVTRLTFVAVGRRIVRMSLQNLRR